MPRIHINPKVSVSVVFVAAMFMNIMDITIVNVALPSIGRQFHETTASLDSVAVGYLVSLAVFIPAAGWLGDRFGSKRVLLFAIAVFTGASALCGLAQSLPELVAFRVVQGVGGGMLTPVGMAMLFRTFPPEERVRASSILTVPTALAPAIGPVLGGLLVTDLSWRWVFFVNLPIGIVAFLFGLVFLDEHRQPHPGRFDVPGFVLSGVGFALLMFGISDGPSRGLGQSRDLRQHRAGCRPDRPVGTGGAADETAPVAAAPVHQPAVPLDQPGRCSSPWPPSWACSSWSRCSSRSHWACPLWPRGSTRSPRRSA